MVSKRIRKLIKIVVISLLLSITLPIFGRTSQARVVEEPVILLDLSHKDTANDVGASYLQWNERDIVNQITLKVGDKLLNKGFTVTYTRELDNPISINERVNLAKNTDYWLYLSIHANSNEGAKAGTGVEAYSNNEWSLSNNILNDLQSEFGLTKRSSPIASSYYNRNIANSSLLEIGFINNDFDRNIMLNEQDKIAQIIADNIINDYNIKHEDSKIVTQELPMYDGSIVPIKITYY